MELEIIRFLNHLGQGGKVDLLTDTISWIPFLAAFWLMLALTALIFDKKNGRWLFWGTIITLAIYFIANDLILKPTLASIFFRERPYLAYPQLIISSAEKWTDSSFWSGHMAITLALSTFYLYFYSAKAEENKLVYFYRRWWVWAAAGLFVILMAFARMHNGMHYPSDVLAGAILGIGYGLLGVFIVKKIRLKLAK